MKSLKRALMILFAGGLSVSGLAAEAPAPHWIWCHESPEDGETVYLRRHFELTDEWEKAELTFTCDNAAVVWVNGEKVAINNDWNTPKTVEIQDNLHAGRNVIAIKASNQGGQAGLLARLRLLSDDKDKDAYLVTDGRWKCHRERVAAWETSDFDASDWKPAIELAGYGAQPWGTVLEQAQIASGNGKRGIEVPDGFEAELLYSVPKGQYGSWVAITFEDRRHLIASPQDGKLCRVTIPPIGSNGTAEVEQLDDLGIGSAQGLCYAYGRLYAMANGGPGSGLYQVLDSDGDGRLDTVEKLQALQGGGEHGPHSVIKDAQGNGLYVVCGNHTDPLEQYDTYLQPKVWDEDFLVNRLWDARGHARGRLAPGGWIAHVGRDGEKWSLYSSGYRNTYDIALNRHGELFTYDADMEWDVGTPWYRPTRICHATSGSEFGWRSGTGKWPTYFPDSLPPAVNIGPGSPTGVVFGGGLNFPTRYQKALFGLDWTFGTIYAIHLQPQGASYQGRKEEFLTGRPLPLTDIAVGPDGALYFTIGGRGTQSALYRVTYTGSKSTKPPGKIIDKKAAKVRTLRRKLEQFHGREAPNAVSQAWPHLDHPDRFVRYAARIAIENQPLSQWRQRVFKLKSRWGIINGGIALARHGKASDQDALLKTLNQLELEALDEPQKLGLLRAYALAFIRLGEPNDSAKQRLIDRFSPQYPASSPMVNRELCRLLVYLGSPTVIGKTLHLMETEKPGGHRFDRELLQRNPGYGKTLANYLDKQTAQQEQQVFYALMLSNVEYGWTLKQRKRYFQWFNTADEKYAGGASFEGFLENIKKGALENTSEAERQALASILGEQGGESASAAPEERPQPEGPGKHWTIKDLRPLVEGGLEGRSFENGKAMYAAAYCVDCHRFRGEGGAIGPDLTNLATRFSYEDLLQSILKPNAVVSDQYQSTIIKKKDGSTLLGRIIGEQDGKLQVAVNPLKPEEYVTVDKEAVKSKQPSPTSLMPPGLIDRLNKKEVLDLLAYLMSRGNPDAPMFE